MKQKSNVILYLIVCSFLLSHKENQAFLPQPGESLWNVNAGMGTMTDEVLACCLGTFTAIAGNQSQVISQIDACCAALASDIDVISQTAQTDFNNTRTALAGAESAIDRAETVCCQGTFTALAAVNNLLNQDFTQIYQAINGTSTHVTQDFNYTMTVIAAINCGGAGCDLSGTYTALAALGLCSPISLSQTNVSSGQILFTTTGAQYCLSESITGSIIISASEVTLDLNNYGIIGTVEITANAAQATIQNGNVLSPVPVDETDAAQAAIVIAPESDASTIKNCYISCSNSINTSGRTAIDVGGTNAQIVSCYVQGGSGGALNDIGLSAGNGIVITGDRATISASMCHGGQGAVSNQNLFNGSQAITHADTAQNQSVINFGKGFISNVAITPNGQYAYLGSGRQQANTPLFVVNNASSITVGSTIITLTMPSFVCGGYLAITPNGQYAYVANNNAIGSFPSSGGTVTVVNNASSGPTQGDLFTLSVGYQPVPIAITPNGQYAFVGNQGENTVNVISNASSAPVVSDTLMVGSRPFYIAITPNGEYAYVANQNDGTVSVISNASSAPTVSDTLTVGVNPSYITITPNGQYAYVTDAGAPLVTVLANVSDAPVVADTFSLNINIIPEGQIPQVAVTPNGQYAYTAGQDSVSGIPVLYQITNASSSPALGNSLALASNPNYPIAIAITLDGKYGYITYNQSSPVDVVKNISSVPSYVGPISGSDGNSYLPFITLQPLALTPGITAGGAGILLQGQQALIQDTLFSGGTALSVAGDGIIIDASTNANIIKNCIATAGGNGYSILTTGTANLIDCIAQYGSGIGFDLSASSGQGLIKGCTALYNALCGFNDSATSSYRYISNIATGNGPTPADLTNDSNYCLLSTETTPGGISAPYYQVEANNSASQPPYISVYNNLTLP